MSDHKGVSELIAILEQDAAQPAPRFPAQALLALRDDQVARALSARIDRGQTVVDARPLPYHPATGLLFVCFDFDPPGPLQAGRDSLLAALNGRSEVVVVMDPFDSIQPNPAQPPNHPGAPAVSVPETDDASRLPFALARPSATDASVVPAVHLEPSHARARAFFSRIGLQGGAAGGPGLGGGALEADGRTRTQIQTQTTYLHGGWTPGGISWVEYDASMDDEVDDYLA